MIHEWTEICIKALTKYRHPSKYLWQTLEYIMRPHSISGIFLPIGFAINYYNLTRI